jgi:hypothetical protein
MMSRLVRASVLGLACGFLLALARNAHTPERHRSAWEWDEDELL